jgi:uncharacterized protein YndB with AHSA1/START domain
MRRRLPEIAVVELALILLAAMTLAVTVAILLVPVEVAYTEEITVQAPVAEVYDNIRFQARLMRWSAWPIETRSDCTVEGPDGEVGARTVFLRPGARERFGHQEVTALESGRRVELRLTSKGPPQDPVLAFELEPLPGGATRVVLRFRNVIRRPFNVLLRLVGVVRWTRAMHRKDLDGLRRFSEPPHLTYGGEPAREAVPAAPG